MYGTLEEMRVLSLFDGISCGRVALERAGIPVEAYYASEIDQHAIRVSQDNWSDIIHIGDVTKVKGEDLGEIDLILAGSPCQGFSKHGAMRGFDDPRSRLFWHFVRLVEECKPTWWFLENVRMKQEWAGVISGAVGYEPIVLNSTLVSAQRRVRCYWTNIPYSGPPADQHIVLRDILEVPHPGLCGRSPRVCVVGKSKADGYNGQGNRVYHPGGKVGTLTTGAPKVQTGGSAAGAGVPHIDKPVIHREDWRMLTPVECERLQTLPDNYTAAVSKTQRYKAVGNGWTVEMVAHLLRGMV